jgi:subtilisin family serine protease
MSTTRFLLRLGIAAVILAANLHSAKADPLQIAAGRDVQAAPEDTEELLVFLEPGADVHRFAQDRGLVVKQGLHGDANAFVLTAPSAAAARQIRDAARPDGQLRRVYVNQRTHYVRMAFVPDDPYFHKNTPSSAFAGQWHLINEYTAGLDARVQGAWNRDLTGSGVIIGMVDDCLQTSHPDLSPNYVSADSWDFGANDSNPDPVYTTDQHGIATAGVAAARGGNGIGVTGAAPLAGLAGLRIDFVNQTTQMFVDATLYHSSGSNTHIKVKNHSYGITQPYIASSAEVDALATSTAAGTLHCFAAGNDRADCNTRDLQKSPNAITVAAMGSDGKYADYSNFGACVMVTAPSSSAGYFNVTTTDRIGTGGYNGSGDYFPDDSYTSIFGGTSSATPVVSGVMALARQAQPALSARFAKHLLALTSNIVDSGDTSTQSGGGWVTNAVGYRFNQNYGFGLINADRFSLMATQYTGVSSLTTQDTGAISVAAAIPDNSSSGISHTFTFSSTTPLEEVLVYVRTTHARRGDLEAWLTSPAGTTGRVFMRDTTDSGANITWTFTCNQFWGEDPAGTWTLNVRDLVSGSTGTWNEFRVTARMGGLVGASGPPVVLLQPKSQVVSAGDGASFKVSAVGGQPLSYRWQKGGADLIDGGRISGATTSVLSIANCDSSDAGDYRCAATNAAGSTNSDPAALTVTAPQIGCLSNGAFEDGFVSGVASQWTQFNAGGSVTCDSSTDILAGSYSQRVRSANLANTGGVYQRIAAISGQQYTIRAWVKTSNAAVMEGYLGIDPAGGTNWYSVPTQYQQSTTYTTWSQQIVTVTATSDHITVFLFARSTKVNTAGYVYFDDVTPDCTAAPPMITQQPVSQSVCPGATATLTVSAAGTTPLTFQWLKNGVSLIDGGHYSGTDATTLTMSNVDTGDVAAYQCVASNAFGDATSNSASLTLKLATSITQQPTPQSPCSGGTASFDVSAVGQGTLAYQWQKDAIDLVNGGHITGANTPALTISDAQTENAGGYRCVVTGECGSTASNTATLVVRSHPAQDLDEDCDVDAADFALFEGCLSGSGVASISGCQNRDFDTDGDVDQSDFGTFQRCMSGVNTPADPNCGT